MPGGRAPTTLNRNERRAAPGEAWLWAGRQRTHRLTTRTNRPTSVRGRLLALVATVAPAAASAPWSLLVAVAAVVAVVLAFGVSAGDGEREGWPGNRAGAVLHSTA
jgi:hypothetical protein